MKITFVKKILANGEPCAKCADVELRLQAAGYLPRIDETLIADERDPDSPGMLLARSLDVDLAPFFVVDEGADRTVYTVYLKFAREVLGAQNKPDSSEEASDILRANPDLDLI